MDEQKGSIPLALVGALVAGFLGLVVWLIVLFKFNYELGILAWGIGFAVGWAVTKIQKGRGSAYQIIAAVITFLSILGAKAVVAGLLFLASKAPPVPGEMPADLSWTKAFSYYDILWLVFGISTAWSVPRAVVAGVAEPGTEPREPATPAPLIPDKPEDAAASEPPPAGAPQK
jgi:hypothetical protein